MADTPVLLVGAGPVGPLLAAALVHNGARLTWVVRSAQRRAELAKLRLVIGDERLELDMAGTDISPTLPPERVAEASWLVLAVKAQHVMPLLDSLQPLPEQGVLVVANGLHEGPFHLGVLYGGARLEDGAVVSTTANRLYVGALGGVTPRAEDLPPLLSAPWLSVEDCPRVEERMWRKLAVNCVVNPLTALLDCPNGALLDCLDSPLALGLLREAYRVGRIAAPGAFSGGLVELTEELVSLIRSTAQNSSSMREDLRAGREPEIAMLNLAVAKHGARLGLSLPLNVMIGHMVSLAANRGAL